MIVQVANIRDDETVETYGIQNGQTVHCDILSPIPPTNFDPVVQTQPPPAAGPGPSSTASSNQQQHGQPQANPLQQIPTNLAAGTGAFNPLAGLTGARYAGQVQLPSASLFGPDRIFLF